MQDGGVDFCSGHYQWLGDNLQRIMDVFFRDLLGEAWGGTYQFGNECERSLAVVE